MAVLPASKAYPRGGAPRRQYVKGAPLFARTALKFNGVDYPRGAELPVAAMSPHKHWELWTCGKADHVLKGPFDSKPPPSQDAPTAPSAATVQSPEAAAAVIGEVAIEMPGVTTQTVADAISDAELEQLTAPAPSEPVTPTTDKRRGRGR